MTEARPTFSAAESGLGFIYQPRLALLKLLSLPESTSLLIEKSDDLEFDTTGGRKTLASLKHKADGDRLTDLDVDFWKSVRVWLTLPAGIAEFEGAKREVSREGRLDFDDVSIEFRMDGITPDVVLRKSVNDVVHELLVEVKVTHGCGPEKIARIREGRHAAVEIDLARWKHASVEDIHAAVLRDAPRIWLYNDKIEAGVVALKTAAQARAERPR